MDNAESAEALLIALMADGVPIDWERQNREFPGDQARLEGLRTLESVVRASLAVQTPPMDFLTGVDAPSIPAPPAEDETPVPGRWGRLEIRKRLGHGTYGEVYEAYDSVLDRTVALKLRLHESGDREEVTRRFLAEARRLAQVRHENVLVIHGAEIHDGRAGLWTENLTGRTLAGILESGGRLDYREAALIGMDLSKALSAIHGAGLLHRDLKPANVMRTDEGRIVLLDFGTAMLDPGRTGSPEESGPMGTPLYLAPELVDKAAPSVRSDIYSLGVLLFHLVTGRYPVEGNSPLEVLYGTSGARRVSLRELRPDIPFAFIDAVERAVAVNPEQRPESAAEVEESLARVLGLSSRPVSARETAAHERGQRGPMILPVRFQVRETLDQNSWHILLRAWDSVFEREVVLHLPGKDYRRFLDRPKFREKIIRQARNLARIDDPSVARIYELLDVPGGPILVGESLPGETLEQLLARHGGSLAPTEILRMAESLGRALQAIHAAGLVHRNVAPANVMIRPDGTVALGGLLYSKALDPSASTSFQYNGPGSPAGMLAALPLYPAPEMFEGQPADPRSDIFAVGCVLHRCLAGADAPLEVIRDSSAPEPSISSDLKRAVRERPAGEPGLDASSSDALVLLIERCLRRSPANRYESADELIRAVTSAHPRPPALTSGALRLALLAAAVLLVGLGSYLAFTQ